MSLSKIAWHALVSFCSLQKSLPWVKNLINYIDKDCSFMIGENYEFNCQVTNPRFIGYMPFTSLHTFYCSKGNNNSTIPRVNKDAIVCVILCLGPSPSSKHEKDWHFQLSRGRKLVGNKLIAPEKVYIYSPESLDLKLVGYPKNYLLLSFFIEKFVGCL